MRRALTRVLCPSYRRSSFAFLLHTQQRWKYPRVAGGRTCMPTRPRGGVSPPFSHSSPLPTTDRDAGRDYDQHKLSLANGCGYGHHISLVYATNNSSRPSYTFLSLSIALDANESHYAHPCYEPLGHTITAHSLAPATAPLSCVYTFRRFDVSSSRSFPHIS